MEFDKENQEFVLAPEDFRVLGVPQELGRWPMRDTAHLVEEIEMAQVRLDSMDETQFPHGSAKHQFKEMAQQQQKTLSQIREVVAEHIHIDGSEIDGLLES